MGQAVGHAVKLLLLLAAVSGTYELRGFCEGGMMRLTGPLRYRPCNAMADIPPFPDLPDERARSGREQNANSDPI